MGYIPRMTPEAGEYSVEVRSESFYLRGEEPEPDRPSPRHSVGVYPKGETNLGTAELLIEDIPKIRAALDVVEQYVAGTYVEPLEPQERRLFVKINGLDFWQEVDEARFSWLRTRAGCPLAAPDFIGDVVSGQSVLWPPRGGDPAIPAEIEKLLEA